jgi:hypothetical protein
MPKKINKTKRKKSLKYKLSKKKYKELIEKKKNKSISKNQNKILENELNKKYCKCIKTFKKKYKKNSNYYKGKYGICMNSIYKNRGLEPPYNISNLCKLYYSF